MRLSIVFSENGFENVLPLELPSCDITIDSFFETALALSGLPQGEYDLTLNGRTWNKEQLTAAGGTLKVLELKEDDLIVVTKHQTPTASSSSAVELSESPIVNLIRSVHIPNSKKKAIAEVQIQHHAMQLYRELTGPEPPARLVQVIREDAPELLEILETKRGDVGAFLILYREYELRSHRRKREQANINSVEGQRLMEAKIRNDRLQHNYDLAIEHTPEVFVRTHMLYVNIIMNGVPCTAFIDTGAQTSIISPDCAEKCNLTSLINERHAHDVIGVGGTTKSAGVIWNCDMEVGGHFLPVKLSVLPCVHEVLIGLDIMLRHRAQINLADRTMTFSQIATTPFLTDEESYKISMIEAASSSGPFGQAAQGASTSGANDAETKAIEAAVAASINDAMETEEAPAEQK